MRLVKRDRKEINYLGYLKKSRNQLLLEDFMNNGSDCMEIVDYNHSNIKSCFNSISKSIIRFGFKDIKCVTRKGKVYLIRISAFL